VPRRDQQIRWFNVRTLDKYVGRTGLASAAVRISLRKHEQSGRSSRPVATTLSSLTRTVPGGRRHRPSSSVPPWGGNIDIYRAEAGPRRWNRLCSRVSSFAAGEARMVGRFHSAVIRLSVPALATLVGDVSMRVSGPTAATPPSSPHPPFPSCSGVGHPLGHRVRVAGAGLA
jgi:hypothetical protein